MQRAHELAPDDYPTALALAGLLEQADRRDEAVSLYTKLEDEVGLQNAGSWHLITLYQLAQIRIRQGRRDEARALNEERARLQDQGVTVPSADESARGNLGTLLPPAPGGGPVPAPEPPALRIDTVPGVLAGYANLQAVTLVDDWRHLDEGCEVLPPDLVGWGPQGLVVARTAAGARYSQSVLYEGQVNQVAVLDLNGDRVLDFVLATTVGMTILVGAEDGASWAKADFPFPSVPTPPMDMEPVDFDHDGDIDLLLVGRPWGARLWRNDGLAVEGGRLTDATKEAGLPENVSLSWCAIEDMDVDQDVDLLFGDAGRSWLMSNERSGRFRERRSVLGDMSAAGMRLGLADFDRDGRPDVYMPTSPMPFLRSRLDGTLDPAPVPPLPGADVRQPGCELDWDLDGTTDSIWQGGGGGTLGHLALGTGTVRTFLSPAPRDPHRGRAAWGDFDADGVPDRAETTPDGLRFVRATRGGNSFRLALRGVKSNARGVGAVVEVRAGPIYRRIFWRGEPQVIGLGKRSQADIVRITWPNGVIQHDLDVESGCSRLIEQAEGLVGSCPFLYTWNGETYEYISDVLGITPMGLPMAPGMLVPPDHDEYVRVRGEQLKPRTLEDGASVYEMQFTEELREVTYLDHARLLVVDHPADTEMYPTERFSFPPFPEHRINVFKPVAAAKVTGSDGRDWTASLARVDGDYAAPFRPHRGQFLGLADPHWLELSFDPALVGSASELRLVCTGWFFWTDASVNMAAARTPGIDFVPPILQVQKDGKWVDAGPPVGFPAGKTKTMVIDVSKLLRAEDPRIRIFSTLRLYWDSIRLAAGPDHPSTVATLKATSAWLWERGFSKPLPGQHALDWFDWDVTASPRWNPHPGMYTRHGECIPLVRRVDDQFVILGAGDALRLRFDAAQAPPLRDGWRRDYLVFLDGWAKDRDPNTHGALFVEPLPFHGMKGYPYPSDQSYPDTPATRRYRDTWNTRPARTWIPSLVPRR
jgi:hypothetical protein